MNYLLRNGQQFNLVTRVESSEISDMITGKLITYFTSWLSSLFPNIEKWVISISKLLTTESKWGS